MKQDLVSNPYFIAFIVIAAIWTIIWKGLALWKVAKKTIWLGLLFCL